ncbi:hypothetical protein [Methylobacterium gnaphalii]|uniref:Uncharacterized protein n=1 Tax=Methylobacterium gnaphalii TaxID=1010610 RepID=A0A512JKE3_9HYPH|nr:hypothetical protein [Methylobacterium gnaphalii]GEP10400.1 hypothetical protein MGN01_22450 [Methylobacterium gnaphalii]GJD69189.1 hypothetical protein MMMDOFMJ_2116 [Methylobacterium gnaphalii]GLS47738.1 hypothetical protein GCM10007885_05820 [Methylobacterium gnaphalii]
MDTFYRGVETSLIALTLALGLGAATLSGLHTPTVTVVETVTLPMISVTAGTPEE